MDDVLYLPRVQRSPGKDRDVEPTVERIYDVAVHNELTGAIEIVCVQADSAADAQIEALRGIFHGKGWRKAVAFQPRNERTQVDIIVDTESITAEAYEIAVHHEPTGAVETIHVQAASQAKAQVEALRRVLEDKGWRNASALSLHLV